MKATGHVFAALGFLGSLGGIAALFLRAWVEFTIPILLEKEHVDPAIIREDLTIAVIPTLISVLGIIIMLIGMGMVSAATPRPAPVRKPVAPDYSEMPLEELLDAEHQRLYGGR